MSGVEAGGSKKNNVHGELDEASLICMSEV